MSTDVLSRFHLLSMQERGNKWQGWKSSRALKKSVDELKKRKGMKEGNERKRERWAEQKQIKSAWWQKWMLRVIADETVLKMRYDSPKMQLRDLTSISKMKA